MYRNKNIKNSYKKIPFESSLNLRFRILERLLLMVEVGMIMESSSIIGFNSCTVMVSVVPSPIRPVGGASNAGNFKSKFISNCFPSSSSSPLLSSPLIFLGTSKQY